MNTRLAVVTAAALAAAGGMAPAFAQTYNPPVYVAPAADPPVYVAPAAPAPYYSERIYVPGLRANGAMHGGWVNPGDDRLIADAVGAFNADRRTDGATVTMVAKNGELIVNGTATNFEQASRMEQMAKRISGGHATVWFDSPGA